MGVALGGLVAAGCGSDDGAEHDHDHHDEVDHTKCVGTETAWEVGTSATSKAGHFKVSITAASPDPVAVGANDWTLTVTNANDEPLKDVTFDDALTWQHVHEHEGAVKPTITAGPDDGTYLAKGFDVVHIGSWEFRLTMTHDGTTDDVVFHFCVQSDPSGGADATDGTDGHTDSTDATNG